MSPRASLRWPGRERCLSAHRRARRPASTLTTSSNGASSSRGVASPLTFGWCELGPRSPYRAYLSRRNRAPTCPSAGGLEQLDRVAGRVLDEDLLAAVADHDLVAEPAASGLQL